MKVLLVDDHTLFRQGLRRLLEMEPDLEVVGEGESGLAAQQLALSLQPDVILLDLSMPQGDGLQATPSILRDCPNTKILILTMHQEAEKVFQALRLGAHGYILKDADSQEIVRAIRAAHQGNNVLSPAVATQVVQQLRNVSENGAAMGLPRLGKADVEALRLLAQGLSNREIAQSLSLSEKTVRNRLSTLFQKLQVRNRTEAALFALREGLAPPGISTP